MAVNKRGHRKPKTRKCSSAPAVPEPSEAEQFVEENSDDNVVGAPEIKLLLQEIKKLKKRDEKLQGSRALINDAVRECFKRPLDLIMPAEPKELGKGKEEVAVLHISDVQYGKTTADYDSVTANRRLQLLAQKAVRITDVRRNGSKIEEIRVYLGGDIVEGELIFPHQAHEIDQSVFDQAVRGAPSALVSVVLYLLKHFKRVHIVSVPGNHGRPASKSAGSSKRTNWDNVVYDILRIMLLGTEEYPHKDIAKRLTMNVSETWYAVDDVLGWGNLLIHGDQVTGGFAGFPWYGVGRRASGWIDSIPESWTYLWLGHFHTYAMATLNHRIMLANGTTESSNTFAQANLAASGFPCQRLAFFNAANGLVADHQVFLAPRKSK